MDEYFIDETGFTGEDLLSPDQPLFVQATNNFSIDDARAIISATFGGIAAQELKYSRLGRNPRHRDRIVELVRVLAGSPDRAGTWIAHKEFALVTLIVDWWVEPLGHRVGLNLYKDGANLAMANMLFVTLEGFWSQGFRRSLLMHFQRMIRARTSERFNECEAFVRNELAKVSADRAEVLRYLWPSFALLGLKHLISLPRPVLDLALPGLVFIGHKWRERQVGPWQVVHDQSSNMAKQKWIWDALSSPGLQAAQFDNPAGASIFPMNVTKTRFGDSVQEKQLQICDVLAGATSAFLRLRDSDGPDQTYRDKLADAGIEKLFLGGLWPGTDVTPEALGTRGWDGNRTVEWIASQVRGSV